MHAHENIYFRVSLRDKSLCHSVSTLTAANYVGEGPTVFSKDFTRKNQYLYERDVQQTEDAC